MVTKIKIGLKEKEISFDMPKNLESLKEKIKTGFEVLKMLPFKLWYIDDENDKIEISNDYDWSQLKYFCEGENVKIQELLIDVDESELMKVSVVPHKAQEGKPDRDSAIPELKYINDAFDTHKNQEEAILKIKQNNQIPEEKKQNNDEPINKIANPVVDEGKRKKARKPRKQSISQKNERSIVIQELISKEFDQMKEKLFKKTVKLLNQSEKNGNKNPKSFNLKGKKCSKCSKSNFVNVVYKCSICLKFFFCSECEEKFYFEHPHVFFKIRLDYQKKDQEIQNDLDLQIKKSPVNLKKPEKEIEFSQSSIIQREFSEILKSSEKQINFDGILDYDVAWMNKENKIQTKFGNKNVQQEIILVNSGKLKWPNPTYLKPILGILGNQGIISASISPGETISLTLEFYTEKLKVGEFCSRWGLFDKEDRKIGDNFDYVIVILENKPSLPFDIKNHKFFHLLKQYRESYQVEKISDEDLLKTLEISDGNVHSAISYLAR